SSSRGPRPAALAARAATPRCDMSAPGRLDETARDRAQRKLRIRVSARRAPRHRTRDKHLMRSRFVSRLLEPLPFLGLIVFLIGFGASSFALVVDLIEERRSPYQGLLTF